MAKRKLSLGKKLLFASITTVVFFVLLELVLWLFGLDYRPEAARITNQFDPEQNAIEIPAEYFELLPYSVRLNALSNELTSPDKDFIWRVRPNPTGEPVFGYTGINSEGFRGRIPKREEQCQSIAVVGNSCVFGWYIKDHTKTITEQLENRLNDAGATSCVYNLGQPGFSTTQALKLYKSLEAELQPDVVVAFMGWNDLWETPYFSDAQTLQMLAVTESAALGWMKDTRTYALLQEGLRGIGLVEDHTIPESTELGQRPRVPMAESMDNFKAIAEGEHSTIIVLPPFAGQEGLKPMLAYHNELRATMANSATLLFIPEMMDSDSLATTRFDADGFHPNEHGAAVIAERLSELILQQR